MSSQVLQTHSFLTHFRVPVKAGGSAKKGVTGAFFACSDVIGGNGTPFQLRWDDVSFFPFNVGLQFHLKPDELFSSIEIENPQTADIVVEFYAGSAQVSDSRLNIVRGRAAPFMHAATVVQPISASVPATDEIEVSGAHPTFPNYIQKAIIVTNTDPASDLEIWDLNDDIIDLVMFRESKLYEMSNGIKIHNPTGAPVLMRGMRVWYIVDVAG